ncbi:hypothetical protein SAY87_017893 [Trapa incisa]|uniref:DUF4378 domain-containing protein n=1 Tax=Trapa incisa TaxID=236973 RepID=A0AAN7QUQ4_9MYRT|nr:hypothetical protein SAY87_017893 [Trapa incisa]
MANPRGRISATENSSFWAKELTHQNVAETFLIFRERDEIPGSLGTCSIRLTKPRQKESEFWSFTTDGKRLVEEVSEVACNLVEEANKAAKAKPHFWRWDRLIVKPIHSVKQRLKKCAISRKSRSKGVSQEDFHQEKYTSSKMIEQRAQALSSIQSVQKYGQLSGNTCSPGAELANPTSPRSRNAYEVICSSSQGTKSFRRRHLSLPDLDSFRSLLDDLEKLTAYTESIWYHHRPFDVLKVGENRGSDTVEMAEERSNDIEAESIFESSDISTSIPQVEDIESSHLQVMAFTCAGGGISPHDRFSSSEEAEIMTGNDDTAKLIRSYYEMDKKDEAEFNFVRDLLELSGLLEVKMGNPTSSMWLSSSLRKDLDDIDRELLFDLVNESLAEIYSRSPACVFSNGKHEILEEVWRRVHWYQSIGSLDVEPTVEDIAARDMKGEFDTWMKVGTETEDVGCEVEDLIFYELLDEVFV